MTGYTSKIIKGCSFESFILSCSQAFFYPTDSEVSERPIDPEYARQVAVIEAEMVGWYRRTPEENRKVLDAERETARQAEVLYEQTKNSENQALQQMREKVLAWKPPTPDHEPLKKFMLEQIDTSMNDLVGEIEKPEPATNKDVEERVQITRTALTRARERHIKHLKNVDTHNSWVRSLKASLP